MTKQPCADCNQAWVLSWPDGPRTFHSKSGAQRWAAANLPGIAWTLAPEVIKTDGCC